MRRLFWVGVGAGLTVLAVRYGRRLVEQYVPKDAVTAMDTATRAARTAKGIKDEFVAGLAEREKELLATLLGDTDPAEAKARGRQAWADLRGSRAAGSGRVPASWAEGPLEDPDDDDGYAFF